MEAPKYLRYQAENLSPRPLQSLDIYQSLDANIIVAGSADKNLRFLEVDTFEEIAKYEVNKKSVNCVTISGISINGDDPFIITAGKDKVMQVWSPASGNLGKDVDLPTTEVLALATYQGTKSYVLIGTKDSKVLLWDLNSNCLVQSFVGHRAGVYAVAITSTIPMTDIHNGNDLANMIIASGSVDHSVRTWDHSTGRKLQKFKHKRSVYSIVITEKSPQPLMVTAGAEYVIRLWDVKTAILLRTFEGHLARVNSLCLWEDFQTLVISGSGDRTLRIHDIITGECICVLQGHAGDVLTVLSTKTDVNALSPSATSSAISNEPRSVIVSSSEDLSLIQWDLQQIITDFYYTSGENCGVRNNTPPYLPALKYIPPPENDVSNLKGLSKEQRRKLKKDMKRQKIMNMSMSMKYKRARSSMSSNGDGGDDDDDDDEPFVFEGLSDDEDDDKKQQKGKKRVLEEEDEEDESFFMKVLQGDDIDEPGILLNKDENKVEQPEEKTKVEELIPVASTSTSDGARRSSWNKIFPLGGDPQGDQVGADISTKLRKASAGMINSMLNMMGVRSRENSICKVGVDPSLQSYEIQSKSRTNSVSAPAGLSHIDDNTAQHSRATTPSNPKTQSSHPSISSPSSHEPAPSDDHLQFKHKAQNALTDYHLAQVEDQMEADKRRQVAAEKLASRLKRRKTGADASSASSKNLTSDEELVSIKEKKLMQHKLQSNRARQSMMVAKGRASEALQKRLDEMNQRRLTERSGNGNPQRGGEEGEGSEEEDEVNSEPRIVVVKGR